MTTVPTILVLGVGNTIMQDDGVGVWAVRSLAQIYDLPSHVRLIEGGVAGLGLLSDLEGVDHLLIIDAMEGTGPPGTLYCLGPENLPKDRGPFMSAHEIGITELLSVAEFVGKRFHTHIIGVQPLEAHKMGLELTLPLRDALPRVVSAVVEELQSLGVQAVKRSVPSHA
jgi:hydrogenase maturation protease